MIPNLAANFDAYTEFDPICPVFCVSPKGKIAQHRFYDSSPISPSGRYVALTEYDYEDHLPTPGDVAHVSVIDLTSGQEAYRYTTAAWDTQLGTQVQWGPTDEDLYFNVMNTDTWVPYGLRVNIITGDTIELGHTVYMVSPDGTRALSPCLRRIGKIQPGYGVIVPEETIPDEDPLTDGIYDTNTQTGETRLLISIQAITDQFPAVFGTLNRDKGNFYGFHVKWSPDGQKIMFILRWRDSMMRKGQSKNWLITMDAAGEDLAIAIDAKTWKGGHHPTWCPDSKHIVMNLARENPKIPAARLVDLCERILRKLKINIRTNALQLRLAMFKYDGKGMRTFSTTHYGSGHPTYHPESNAVLTDAYPNERVAAGDGTVPLRWIKAQDDSSTQALRIATRPRFSGPRQEWRVDPHPAWNLDRTHITFNACPDGYRRVYIADMRPLLRGTDD